MKSILQWIATQEQQMFSDAWSVAMLEDTLKYDYNSIFIVYDDAGVTSCEDVRICTTDASNIRGYIIVNDVADTSELLRIGVDQAYRKQGYAKILMKHYFEQIRCGQYLLEVRVNNMKARALYEQFAYKELGTRKNYYSNPTEDGVIYERISEGD